MQQLSDCPTLLATAAAPEAPFVFIDGMPDAHLIPQALALLKTHQDASVQPR